MQILLIVLLILLLFGAPIGWAAHGAYVGGPLGLLLIIILVLLLV